METILEIKDYESDEKYPNVAGYEVVTNKQKIRLFIDNEGQCCENWGYFWCNDDPQEFVGAEVTDVCLVDGALEKTLLEFHCEHHNSEETALMFVNIETDKGTLQFVAYNEHNGYYGHKATVESGQLHEEEYL